MNNIFVVLISLLVFAYIDKVSGNWPRIVGGDNAPLEYGRFHASIQNLTGHHVCGGAVVSKWLIVTAAHCVYEVNPDFMKIVSGTNNLSSGGKQYDVVEVIPFYNYNSKTRENDIALIKIKEPFNFRYIGSVKLRKQELLEGDDVILTGFGAREPNGESSCDMQALNLSVFNQEVCEYAMRYASTPVTKEMFCTFSKVGEGTCHGDSGSPLIKGNELVGVVSWGIPCAVGFPDVHTRISPFVDWIQEHIVKAHCEPPKSTRTILQRLEYISRFTIDVPQELTRLLQNLA